MDHLFLSTVIIVAAGIGIAFAAVVLYTDDKMKLMIFARAIIACVILMLLGAAMTHYKYDLDIVTFLGTK